MSKTVLKKMSIKTLIGSVPAVLANESKQLARIVGSIVGTKVGVSTYGEWTAFLGRFRSQDYMGKVCDSRVFLAPATATQELNDAIARAGEGVAVEFILDVHVVGKTLKEGQQGMPYEYVCTFQQQAEQSDPLDALIDTAQKLPAFGANAQIEGPKPATETVLGAPVEAPAAPAAPAKKGGK